VVEMSETFILSSSDFGVCMKMDIPWNNGQQCVSIMIDISAALGSLMCYSMNCLWHRINGKQIKMSLELVVIDTKRGSQD